MRKRLGVLLSFIFCLFLLAGCTLGGTAPGGVIIPEDASPTAIAEACLESCVSVYVEHPVAGYSLGSGVAVRANGFIVTNYHVISDLVESTGFSLSVIKNKGSEFIPAKLLWSDKNLDLAVIKAEINLPYVNMLDRSVFPSEENKLRVLEPVIAIGTPLSIFLQNSCNLGRISGMDRVSSTTDQQGNLDNIYEDLIQHDATITNGNSGGPLFDLKGNVIGLNTLGQDGVAINFAVPIYPAILIMDKIVEAYNANTTYYTPKIGVAGYDALFAAQFNNITFNQDGFYVSDIKESTTPLQVGDIINAITLYGVKYDITERNDLIYSLLRARSGDIILVDINRNGTAETLTVTLG